MKTETTDKETFDLTDWSAFRDEMQKRGYLLVLWHKDDIKGWIDERYPKFKYTKEDIDAIAYDIEHYFDAEYGVNWQTIDSYAWEYINNKQPETLEL